MSQPRTEPASPRRLVTALAAGIRPISYDLIVLSVTASAWFLLSQNALELWRHWKQLFVHSLDAIGRTDVRVEALMQEASSLVLTLSVVGVAIVVVTLLAWGVQGGLRFRSRAQQQRVSVQDSSWLRTGWLCVKAIVIAMALSSVMHASLRAVLASATADLGYALRVLRALMDLGASRVGIALALLVIADAIVARIVWRRGLRMTREELRRELRETEGDRTLRNERRRRQHATALDA